LFYDCGSLTEVIIPDKVTSIEGFAFSDCSSLADITIPDGVIGIGRGAFQNCSSLTSITIPESVTEIYDGAFSADSLLLMKGYTGSCAETYAKENGITFQPIGTIAGITQENSEIPANDKTTATKYTITYKTNGGTLSSKAAKTYTGTKKVTLLKPVRKGYTFAGWYADSKCKTKVTTIKKGSTGNKTFYAKWKKVSVAKVVIKKAANTKGKKLVTTWKKVSGAKGYQISYSTKRKFTKAATVTKTISKRSYTAKKLKKGKTYYVRVRAYKIDSAGKKVYGKWSGVKKVKIKK
jgi:uncharacterized repeat protein (TIGR02543 family)